jgi:prevent-host-death family protein
MKTLTLTEARNQLLHLCEEIERRPATVVEVSKRGKKVMTLLSAEAYTALLETLEILGDATASRRLARALKEIDSGQAIPWEKAKRTLDIEE